MSVIVSLSVSAVTTRAAIGAGAAIVVMLIIGWRKPARAEPRSPRGQKRKGATGIVVDHHPTPLHRRPGPLRRLLALATSGALGVLIGVLVAILFSFAVAAAVIYLTNLLEA